MVPKELVGYFTTSAQIAGSLIGLLFVSISLRYEAILGKSAEFRSRALASITFIGLFNVLTISIWALVPSVGLGYPALVSGLVCLYRTLRLHLGKLGGIGPSWANFLLSAAVYLSEIVEGALLIAAPGDKEIVSILAYTLYGAMASSLRRAWLLLQPGGGGSDSAPVPAASPVQPIEPIEPRVPALSKSP